VKLCERSARPAAEYSDAVGYDDVGVASVPTQHEIVDAADHSRAATAAIGLVVGPAALDETATRTCELTQAAAAWLAREDGDSRSGIIGRPYVSIAAIAAQAH
jgi:hypothetical protein